MYNKIEITSDDDMTKNIHHTSTDFKVLVENKLFGYNLRRQGRTLKTNSGLIWMNEHSHMNMNIEMISILLYICDY